jgi:hypothetical protein
MKPLTDSQILTLTTTSSSEKNDWLTPRAKTDSYNVLREALLTANITGKVSMTFTTVRDVLRKGKAGRNHCLYQHKSTPTTPATLTLIIAGQDWKSDISYVTVVMSPENKIRFEAFLKKLPDEIFRKAQVIQTTEKASAMQPCKTTHSASMTQRTRTPLDETVAYLILIGVQENGGSVTRSTANVLAAKEFPSTEYFFGEDIIEWMINKGYLVNDRDILQATLEGTRLIARDEDPSDTAVQETTKDSVSLEFESLRERILSLKKTISEEETKVSAEETTLQNLSNQIHAEEQKLTALVRSIRHAEAKLAEARQNHETVRLKILSLETTQRDIKSSGRAHVEKLKEDLSEAKLQLQKLLEDIT